MAILLSLTLVLGSAFFINSYLTQVQSQENNSLRNQLITASNNFEDVINSRLYMLDDLASQVAANPEIDQRTFERLARNEFVGDAGVRSLQLARNTIISHVYPMTGNQQSMGHDLLNDPLRKAATLRAIKNGRVTVEGPVELRQGGRGMVYRQPIELHNDSKRFEQGYWGLAVLVVNWDGLIQETIIDHFGDEVALAMRKQVDDQWDEAFLGDDSIFEASSVIVDMTVPNGRWQLAAKLKTVAIPLAVYSVIGGLLIGGLLFYFIMRLRKDKSRNAFFALAVALVLMCVIIFGFLRDINNSAKEQILSQELEIARSLLRVRLQENLDYIVLLARARSGGNLSSEDFHRRAGQYVKDHPEMINITWVDRSFTIIDVSPLKGNRQILNLAVDLDEPKRVSRLARELRQPVYSRPFGAIQGKPSFEVWVPVFNGDKFLGLFAGVYSIADFFEAALPAEIIDRFGVSMESSSGQVVAAVNVRDKFSGVISHSGMLTPPGYDHVLRLTDYDSFPFAGEMMIVLAALVAVGAAIFRGMFILQGAKSQLENKYNELSQARNELYKEKELLKVTLKSIGDGVITIDIAGRVLSLNPIAERITNWTANSATNVDLHELLPLVDEKDNSLEVMLRAGISQMDKAEYPLEFEGYLSAESNFRLDCSLSSIRDDSGGLLGGVIVLHDITAMHKMTVELAYRARHDSLTGLINRAEFEHRLITALQESKIDNASHVLLYLDLDQFKVVNDTCGHLAGDSLLHQVSSVLQKQLRRGDTLARLGGDEFGVLLKSCEVEPALLVAEKLRRAIEDYRFVWDSQIFSIGVSIGFVAIDRNADSHTQILSAADVACYMAKDAGRNRIHSYEADDRETVLRQGEMRWVSRIAEALEQNRFCLYQQTIQPLGDIDEGEHFEILIRMQEKNGELVNPGAFLPAAERYGKMPALDRWVVCNVLDYFTSAPEHLEKLSLCSINISGQSICDQEFLKFMCGTLDNHPMSHKLCLEITETAAISNMVQATHFISELKKLGCRFSLDDFGSGMSSFAYLKQLPVDYLKIDGSFVRDCATDPVDLSLVNSINEIGHVMGMKTVAEFVEDNATIELLKGIGIDYAQGYAIAKPQPLIVGSLSAVTERSLTNSY